MLNVDNDGPFPFRIVYLHTSTEQRPGLSLRWSRSATPTQPVAAGSSPPDGASATTNASADSSQARDRQSDSSSKADTTGASPGADKPSLPADKGGSAAEGVYVYENIPAGRLFTDAMMERHLLLAGSISGASMA